MDKICNSGNCTGCGVCAASCPRHCISLEPTNALGHLYPIIDGTACIDCGVCAKACPENNAIVTSRPEKAFAAWSSDKSDYESSASGGAASVLSSHIIKAGGVVYGCALLPGITVRHIRVMDKQSLPLLKGSKYVQSDISDVFKTIKEDVTSGRPVLFIGTPCQVSSIKAFFKGQAENLYFVDLVCHGVPSLQLLKSHLNDILQGEKWTSLTFRKGTDFCLEVTAGTGDDRTILYSSSLSRQRYKDFYLNSFFDGYTYRDCCYRCRYASPKRVSDVTIGDFWGLGVCTPATEIPEHRKGCSLILPNTDKGKELLEKISSDLNIYERPVSEAIEGNSQLKAPFRKGPRIRLFRELSGICNRPLAYFIITFDLRIRRRIKSIFQI